MTTLVVKLSFNRPVTDDLLQSLAILVDESNAEPGCLQYEAFVNVQDSMSVVFVENWQSAENLEAHSKGEPVAIFKQAVGEFIVNKVELLRS